jgi:hypothetical protein
VHPIQKPALPEQQRWVVEIPPLGEQTRAAVEIEVEIEGEVEVGALASE